MDQTVTEEELQYLKQWSELPLRQQATSPFPATPVMQRLLSAGYMQQVTQPDASGSGSAVVIGYVLTAAGEEALNRGLIA